MHHHVSNQWVARLPYVAIAGFAVCLLIAGRRQDRGLNRWVGKHPLISVMMALVPTTLFVADVVVDPTRFHGGRPSLTRTRGWHSLSTIVIACLLMAIWRHGRRWHLGKDPVQLALVLASGMSIGAVLSFEHGKFAQLSWWDYHAYLFAGFGAAVYAVVVRGRRQNALAGVLGDVFVDDPFAHIVRGYPEALSTLVKAVEVKDSYTHGHSERTAELAVELGLQMSLPSDRLRIIARGAYLHDLGKIAIPDQILNKPGALTPEERKVVETHPRLGYELASTAPSLREVLTVILHHHERLDGHGLPVRPVRFGHPTRGTRGRSRRRVGRAHLRPRLSRRLGPGPCPRSHRGRSRNTLRPGRRRRVGARHVQPRVSTTTDPGVAEEAWSAAQTCHEIDVLVPSGA